MNYDQTDLSTSAGSIFVVIPVHNRREFTKRCLEDLEKQTVQDFEVVVFDDGSTDGTSEMIKEHFPEVHLLRGDGDCWWTHSVNRAVEYALDQDGEYILAINDDVRVPPEFLQSFVKVAREIPEAVQGASPHHVETGEKLSTGKKMNWLLAKSYPSDEQKSIDGIQLTAVTHLPGRGLWIPSSVFDAIGLFDEEQLPQYAADYDFTHRARRHGYNIYQNSDAIIKTYPEESGLPQIISSEVGFLRSLKLYFTDIKSPANFKNRFFLAKKNCPLFLLPVHLLIDYLRVTGGFFKRYFSEGTNS